MVKLLVLDVSKFINNKRKKLNLFCTNENKNVYMSKCMTLFKMTDSWKSKGEQAVFNLSQTLSTLENKNNGEVQTLIKSCLKEVEQAIDELQRVAFNEKRDKFCHKCYSPLVDYEDKFDSCQKCGLRLCMECDEYIIDDCPGIAFIYLYDCPVTICKNGCKYHKQSKINGDINQFCSKGCKMSWYKIFVHNTIPLPHELRRIICEDITNLKPCKNEAL